MEKIIKIDEEAVNELQAKDVEAQTCKEIMMQILDLHKLDTDGSVMDSPVFKAYEQEVIAKRLAFEQAKDKMASENIPSDIANKVKEWSLNYYTNELILTI